MNLKFYIESGILENYVLGLLSETENDQLNILLSQHAVLRNEMERIQLALEDDAHLNAIQPALHVEDIVIDTIKNLQKEKLMNDGDLPLVNRFADYKNWLGYVATMGDMPLGPDGRFVKVLRQDSKVIQMLVVSTTNIEEEVHEDEQESFLILEGNCKCTISGEVRLMGQGEFMAIPMFEPHDVEVVSPKVMAILQRIRV